MDDCIFQAGDRKEMMDAREKRARARRDAVREAYWNASDPSDFNNLNDSLRNYCDTQAPTAEQVRILFFILPDEIIGDGIKWGFGDSAVRDDIAVFVHEKHAEIEDAIERGVSDRSHVIAVRQPDAAVEAIKFALHTDCSMEFLRAWLHGNFDAIRAEWPECPASVFVGADPTIPQNSTVLNTNGDRNDVDS